MDYEGENSIMNNSRMAPPSGIPRLGSPGKLGLATITDSQSNARSNQSMLPPPPSLKHKLGPTYNEPESKRKTLVERAGEPRSIATATHGPRAVVKGTSLLGAGKSHSRNTSFSSSVSSRTPSISSRNISGSSFSSSVGPGRPLSAYGNRTQNVFSQSSTGRPTTAIPKPRPATSMETHESDEDLPAGKRKGTEPLTSIPSSIQLPDGHLALQNRKLRQPPSAHCLRASKTMGNLREMREASVSTMMSNLHLDGEVYPKDSREHQAYSPTRQPRPRPALSPKASISTGLRNMRLDSSQSAVRLSEASGDNLVAPKTPSQIPLPSKVEALVETPNPTPIARRTPRPSPQKPHFLTKDSNINSFTGWDVELRLEGIEGQFAKIRDTLESTTLDRTALEESLAVYKARVNEVETARQQLFSSNQTLQSDLDNMRQKVEVLQQKLLIANTTLDDQIRAYRLELDDAGRENRNQVEKLRRDNADEIDRLLRLHRDEIREVERKSMTELEDRIRELERRNDAQLEEERSRRIRDVQEMEGKLASESTSLDLALQKKDREIQNMRGELEDVRGELDREQTLKNNALGEILQLKQTVQETGTEVSSTISTLGATVASLRARMHFLESGSKAQSDSFADMESRLQDAVRSAEESKRKLIKEETLRRILFNQVQELKGNIRVMARIRPVQKDAEGDVVKLTYPDLDKESKELEILGKEEKSSLGTINRKTHAFTFDRVFGPESQNQEVFEEISQLVQSALDGYNVCIFCYGQTGSGKTHTMSSADGMIPRATHQIYETATNLKEKGWTYTMEGSFVEVYNEEIYDLLGSSKDFDKKKHEIRHDESKKQTTVTGLKTVSLDSADTVESILKQAGNNRSVAATKSNERSSRSHSVFILKLVGRNSTTGETSEGTLNLVDLAGSERLKQSGAEGERMKETQNINKSLSCLGDVIGALGQGKEGAHIPYRNSKLTYLLQYSLGGNSKTLMFVMASPLEAHLSETLTSLKFATKVHNTHIGTAKKTKKVSSD